MTIINEKKKKKKKKKKKLSLVNISDKVFHTIVLKLLIINNQILIKFLE